MTARHPAWLLRAARDVTCAVAQYEMIEFVTDARVQRVPLANSYCEHLALWRDRLVPVVDLARLLSGGSHTVERALSVLAYQPRTRQPLEYLGIWTEAAPRRVDVGDDQACELPVDWGAPLIRDLARSCFRHEEQAVPILDLTRLARYSPQ